MIPDFCGEEIRNHKNKQKAVIERFLVRHNGGVVARVLIDERVEQWELDEIEKEIKLFDGRIGWKKLNNSELRSIRDSIA